MNWQCTEAFVALGSIELDQLVTFYTQLFGQHPQPYQPKIYAEYRLPGLRLAIFVPKLDHELEFGQSRQSRQSKLSTQSTQSKTSSMSICLQVLDLEPVITELAAMNYPRGNIITASHGRELYIYDPDGNRLIFYEPKL
ncbi:MAG: VOC family protein [Coleofasciculaceae cyanobacterium SM2_1_6]|nr:VOC family protein [Coleofasciculaceae cyanobacterium SM2_1_6]